MPTSSESRSSREKVREHRARLRALGLKPIQIWVPDVNSPAFKAEAHRQSGRPLKTLRQRPRCRAP